ncbi:hypothetical protein [Hymenobacter sp. B81]|uniref:hypothetical protein n=1 Tax=Hymenobacter sp. B81 TaxID=3344878 RepID=UPI0037DDAA14
MKSRWITYDLGLEHPAPAPDDFLVSIVRRNQVGTVYHIASARLMKSKRPGRYQLEVYAAPELKPETAIDTDGDVFVRGIPAYSLVWYPRK